MKHFPYLLTLISASLLLACGGSSDGAKGDQSCSEPEAICSSKAAPYVIWENVPKTMNPEVEKRQFSLDSIRQIHLSFFDFYEDIDLIYSDALDSNTGEVEVYTVRSQDSKTSLKGFRSSATDGKVDLAKYGNHSCTMIVEDGTINSLEGSCFVRIAVSLPVGSNVELYNGTRLLSGRFHTMANGDLLEALDQPIHKDQKKALIDDYLESYRLLDKTPSLNDEELETIVGEFSFPDNRMETFTKLHKYVSDRESLRPVIGRLFNSSDQLAVLKIAGLKPQG